MLHVVYVVSRLCSRIRFLSCFVVIQVDDAVCSAPGVSSLRINGAIHHRMGHLLPSDLDGAAQFAQIYVLDNAEDQLNRRMAIMPMLSPTIMQRLSEELHEHNAFARAFHEASQMLSVLGDTVDLKFTIKGHSSGTDSRRFNTPVATEMAAWIPDGAEPARGCRDIKLFARSGEVRHISELHPAYMALHFPLLFPYGEAGWHPAIPFRTGFSSSATDIHVQDVLDGPSTSLELFNSVEHLTCSIPHDTSVPRHEEIDEDVGGSSDPDPVLASIASRERGCTLLRYACYHMRRREAGNFSIFHSGRYSYCHLIAVFATLSCSVILFVVH
jgi:hypothetical protein